jgi:quercetin dioxygenase-like cupin family protein
MKANRFIVAMVLVGVSALAQQVALAQSDIGRTEVQRHNLSVPGREVVQVRVDFPPGAAFPRHRHPGEEVAHVLEGSVEYQLEGRPPITLKAGDSLFIPPGAAHTARNVGGGKASELATYIVEIDKPPLELAK